MLVCLIVNPGIAYKCTRKKPKEMSRTKCVAGRRFFARLDQIPAFVRTFSKTTLVQPYLYPWIADILSSYAGQMGRCAGSLVNDRYILTAQHCCLPPLEPIHLMVTLGYQRNGPPNRVLEPVGYGQYPVLDIILHPNYDYTNAQTAANDLALIKIRPVQYSKTIYPIQLPTFADKYYDLSNQIAENAGWQYPLAINGNQGHSFSHSFQNMPVQIISNEQCSNFNIYYKHSINPDVLCTINVERGNVPLCRGDGGAPLMVDNYKRVYNVTILVGIVSWSAPKNKPCIWYGSPVVYVRISNKLPWILDNTKDALYCRY